MPKRSPLPRSAHVAPPARSRSALTPRASTPARATSAPSHRFEDRYRGNWGKIARRTRRLVFDRCILNPLHPAAAVHHLRYRDWRGAIAGREIPGWDVVPLCRTCHGRVHRQALWFSAPRQPQLNNRQRWQVLWRLRLRFFFWFGFFRIGWLLVLFCLGVLTAWLFR